MSWYLLWKKSSEGRKSIYIVGTKRRNRVRKKRKEVKANREILLFYIFLLEAKLKKKKRKDSGTDCVYGVSEESFCRYPSKESK